MVPAGRVGAVLFWLASFSSIAALLTHLVGGPSMHAWTVIGGPVVLLVMLGVVAFARRRGEGELLLRLRVGLVGGLVGTLGYDLVRVPFHHLGQNLLSPIRAYGLWVTGASVSTTWTDLAGFLYHLSNGLTFAWIYAIALARRPWPLAVAWALLLETLALVTPFGVVFGIRSAYGALALAYAAHLAYGVPLGLLAASPETRLARWWPLHRTPRGRYALLLLVATVAWFVGVRPAGTSPPPAGTVVLGPEAIRPTWSDLRVGDRLTIQNDSAKARTVVLRRAVPGGRDVRTLEVAAGTTAEVALEATGILQVAVDGGRWRSVFVAVSRDGDYRPDPPARR